MSAVSEWVVREYFEQLGYLVSQPRKYGTGGRQKSPAEEVDLVVHDPRVKEHRLPDGMVWRSEHLRTVARAVVAVRGWHTDRFYARTFEQAPDILRFVEPGSLKVAAGLLGSAEMAKILGTPQHWVAHQARTGAIPSIQLGHYRRFSPTEVLEAVRRMPLPHNCRFRGTKKAPENRGGRRRVSMECPNGQEA